MRHPSIPTATHPPALLPATQLLPVGSSGGVVALYGVAFTVWGLLIRQAGHGWVGGAHRSPATPAVHPALRPAALPAHPSASLCSWAGSACTSPIFAEVVPSQLRSIVYSFDREGEMDGCLLVERWRWLGERWREGVECTACLPARCQLLGPRRLPAAQARLRAPWRRAARPS